MARFKTLAIPKTIYFFIMSMLVKLLDAQRDYWRELSMKQALQEENTMLTEEYNEEFNDLDDEWYEDLISVDSAWRKQEKREKKFEKIWKELDAREKLENELKRKLHRCRDECKRNHIVNKARKLKTARCVEEALEFAENEDVEIVENVGKSKVIIEERVKEMKELKHFNGIVQSNLDASKAKLTEAKAESMERKSVSEAELNQVKFKLGDKERALSKVRSPYSKIKAYVDDTEKMYDEKLELSLNFMITSDDELYVGECADTLDEKLPAMNGANVMKFKNSIHQRVQLKKKKQNEKITNDKKDIESYKGKIWQNKSGRISV